MPTKAAPTLELLEFEKIVSRGVQKQTWAVRLEGRWVLAPKVPGAVVLESPSQPGVVWQRHVQLQLQPGTYLRRNSEAPQPQKARDVFSVMTVDARADARIRREEFCVTAQGKLERPASR